MLKKAKKMYSKIVSVATALAMACTASVFTVSSASATEYADNELAEIANNMAILVNQEREALGLKPLYVVPYLNECAQTRAEEAAVVFSHTRPDGTYCSEVIDYDSFQYGYFAENLAAGADNYESAFNQWKNSEKHWTAITNENITHMGLGVTYVEGSEYGWYWTQIFTNDLVGEVEHEGQYLPSNYSITPADEGDVNGDAIINTFDYITLTEYLRKKNSGTPVYLNDAQLEAADCFKDGIVSEADAKVMMRYILGEYKSLPFVF
ncbi:MAG: SCP-like extracellular [Ruminococcus sp.]|nr:SCP-like extracellular [Ruminococcus sp.]